MNASQRSTLIGILVLLLFFGVGTYFAARALMGESVPIVGDSGRVAVLPVEGVIASEMGFTETLERFRDDSRVRAFLLEIRSPGGTVGGSQNLYRELRRLREEDDRPVVAWIGEMGASGGYYVSLAADSIYALPGSITGSIGVIMQFPNAGELLDDVGIELDVVKSGEFKDIGSFTRPLSESDREVLNEMIDDVYGQFVGAVAENRSLDRERVIALADGRIYSGQRARELGLIDGIASFSEALDVAGRMSGLGADPPVLRPRDRRIGVLELLTGISEDRVRGWIRQLVGSGATPELLYQWR